MKKLAALVLALVMCLSMFACSANEYVGEYEGKTDRFEDCTLNLFSSGKYILVKESDEYDGEYSIFEEEGTWKSVDGYVVFDWDSSTRTTYSSENNAVLETDHHDSGYLEDAQYELKGVYFYNDHNTKVFKKVSDTPIKPKKIDSNQKGTSAPTSTTSIPTSTTTPIPSTSSKKLDMNIESNDEGWTYFQQN